MIRFRRFKTIRVTTQKETSKTSQKSTNQCSYRSTYCHTRSCAQTSTSKSCSSRFDCFIFIGGCVILFVCFVSCFILFFRYDLCSVNCEICCALLCVFGSFRTTIRSVFCILGSFFTLAENILTQIYDSTNRTDVPEERCNRLYCLFTKTVFFVRPDFFLMLYTLYTAINTKTSRCSKTTNNRDCRSASSTYSTNSAFDKSASTSD